MSTPIAIVSAPYVCACVLCTMFAGANREGRRKKTYSVYVLLQLRLFWCRLFASIAVVAIATLQIIVDYVHTAYAQCLGRLLIWINLDEFFFLPRVCLNESHTVCLGICKWKVLRIFVRKPSLLLVVNNLNFNLIEMLMRCPVFFKKFRPTQKYKKKIHTHRIVSDRFFFVTCEWAYLFEFDFERIHRQFSST